MVSRDIRKLIGDYDTLIESAEEGAAPLNAKEYSFYAGEAQQLLRIEALDLGKLLNNALKAGFMVGYNTAKHETQQSST